MRGLVPYAWRSLAARPMRTLLTVSGVALGVAVLVAALAVHAGLDASVDRTVASLVGRADLRVAAFAETGLTGETLAAVESVPGVALAAPAIERRTFLVPGGGRSPSTEPVTVLGIDPTREPRVRDVAPVRGAALDAIDEPVALVTERLAAAEGLDLGSELQLLGAGAPLRVRVVGVLPGDGPALGIGGRTVVLPIATADPGTVAVAIDAQRLAQPYVLSVPGDVAASLRASTTDIRSIMALLAGITMFASAFLIFNTLAMTVVERIRELALLRAAGAGRAQVMRVVLAQALLLGAAGSTAGLVLGVRGSPAAWRSRGSPRSSRPGGPPGSARSLPFAPVPIRRRPCAPARVGSLRLPWRSGPLVCCCSPTGPLAGPTPFARPASTGSCWAPCC
jgi:putative ABC transport system permease protein